MTLEEHHHLADHAVAVPGLADGRQLLLGNPGDIEQFLDILFKNLEGLFPEMVDDFPRGLRPDTFNQPGTEIFFQGRRRRRFQLEGPVGLELAPELAVHGPAAAKLHGRPGKDPGLVDGDRFHLIGPAEGNNPQHRPAGLIVMVGDPLHHAADDFLDIGHGQNASAPGRIRVKTAGRSPLTAQLTFSTMMPSAKRTP